MANNNEGFDYQYLNRRKNNAVLISSQSATKNVKQTQWDFNHNTIISSKIKWFGMEPQNNNDSMENDNQLRN